MKRSNTISLLIAILILLVNSNIMASYAIELKYSAHTSKKDIELKKKKALDWYEDNVTNKKMYFYNPESHIASLKKRALGWYEDFVINKKSYLLHADAELAFGKKKALRWYERNSQEPSNKATESTN